MGTPRLVLVTGPAGAGKTTLAHRLATAIGCPAICRDELKEGMVASNPGFEAGPSDELTMRTYGLFFSLIDQLVAAQVTTVAEAAFQHHNWVRGLESVEAGYDLRIIRCRVSPEVAAQRMRARLTTHPTRTAHADAAHLAAAEPFAEIQLSAPTIDVDTSTDYEPSLPAIVSFAMGS